MESSLIRLETVTNGGTAEPTLKTRLSPASDDGISVLARKRRDWWRHAVLTQTGRYTLVKHLITIFIP
jgi:hypothetical protein